MARPKKVVKKVEVKEPIVKKVKQETGEFITDIVHTYFIVNGVEMDKIEYFNGNTKVAEETKTA
jgi:hypothetical protein